MTEGERLMAVATLLHMHPLSVALLAKWARTPEGQRFANGKRLQPMDCWVNRPRTRKREFDWGLDD